jgi:hypothetical protein
MNRKRFINIASAGSLDVHEYAGLLLVKQAARSAQPFSMTLVQKLAPAPAVH